MMMMMMMMMILKDICTVGLLMLLDSFSGWSAVVLVRLHHHQREVYLPTYSNSVSG